MLIDYFGVHLKRKLRTKISPFQGSFEGQLPKCVPCRGTNPALKSWSKLKQASTSDQKGFLRSPLSGNNSLCSHYSISFSIQPSPVPSVPEDPISLLSSTSLIVLFLQFLHTKPFSQWDCKRGWSSEQGTASPSLCLDVRIKNNDNPAKFKPTGSVLLVRAGLQEESTHLLPTICPLMSPQHTHCDAECSHQFMELSSQMWLL